MSHKHNTTTRVTAVGEIMSETLETINLLNSAKEAALKMTEKNVSSLLVVDDDGKPVGIVPERDLVRKVCTKDIPSQLVTIQNVISSPIKTISSETPIDEVADFIVRNKIRHVVVVGDSKKKNNRASRNCQR
jgi:signal-transduction protein with cAMP-binding, CBS, and nucleotidyltransferase domain